jgi:hypothetical protein
LVEEHTNKVSIPSELPAGVEAARGLFTTRAGRVKERRTAFEFEAAADGGRSGVLESSGGDMAGGSGGHRHGCPTVFGMRAVFDLEPVPVCAGSVDDMDMVTTA